MAGYNVTVSIDGATRDYLMGHSYSMYVFKGVQAGGGAVSTVWQTITGQQLYGQATNVINWTENFYIGETQVQMTNGATITGTAPYNGADGNPAPVALGKLYTYDTTGWQPQPKPGPQPQSFAITNLPKQTNNFYVSQNDSGQYIVVQNLVGNGGLGTFQPLESIAILLATQSYDTGTLIIQTYTPGIIAMLSGQAPNVQVAYNVNTGWSGPGNQTKNIGAVDSMYDALINATPG
ncbi:MAG TPA: hypothetical protein VLZ74_00195 [Methylocella sp.]|nr:hypothetical protein [Methylocella sp.]